MERYDVIIRNGRIMDGTGRTAGYTADVFIRDGMIVKIGDDHGEDAERILDASNHLVTPGFIDSHSHADQFLPYKLDGYNKLEQGITTELCGQCGISPVPYYPDNDIDHIPAALQPEMRLNFGSYRSAFRYLDSQELGTNIALLAANGAIRGKVMGYASGRADAAALADMKAQLDEAMDCGCFGLSSGLIYPPSIHADTEELIDLAKVASARGGIYASHIRGESDNLVNAVKEALEIGERAHIPVVISHHKVFNMRNEGLSKTTLKLMEEANQRGVYVRLDQYPYTASSTELIYCFPPQFVTEGGTALVNRLKDAAFRKQMNRLLLRDSKEYDNFLAMAGFAGSMVVCANKTPQYLGKTLQQIAELTGKNPFDATYDLLIENLSDGGGIVDMVFFNISQSDHDRILAHPYTMCGTDGNYFFHEPREQTGGGHPRGTGAFIRHLKIVRDRNLFTPEEAIHRITGAPAQIEGFLQIRRGLLKPGFHADICVLDWERLTDRADYTHPFRQNEGLKYVLVNGRIAVENNAYTGVKAGRLLRRAQAGGGRVQAVFAGGCSRAYTY